MDLSDYIRLWARRWRIVAAVLLLGTVTGCLAGRAETPWYRATATLLVTQAPGTAETARPDRANTFAEVRARSYAAVVAGPAVTGPVLRDLGLTLNAGQLANRITADAPRDTALVRISAVDPVPTTAARLANAVARRFAVVVEDLERPVGGGPEPVRVTVAVPASVPSAPSLPHRLRDVMVGLLAGLVLGPTLALILDGADSTLRTADALAMELDLIGGPPLLATIAKDRRVARLPVAVAADPHGPRAQGYRTLGTTLRSDRSERDARVLAVTSPHPGEGRTTTAVNLAAALGESGARVCLVDADLGRARLVDTLGLTRNVGLTSVLTGQAALDDALQSLDTFTVLSSGPLPTAPAELLGSQAMRSMLRDLAERFDHVVVDTGPLLPVADAAVLAPAVDAYLLVVRAHRTTRRELARAVRILGYTSATPAGTVLNRATQGGTARPYHRGLPARATLPTPRRDGPMLQLLTLPCAPTTHTTAPMSTVSTVSTTESAML